MSDQAPGPSLEERTTTALESIAFVLNQLLIRVPVPPPRPLVEEVPVDASLAYMAGQFKRRPGNIIPTPSAAQLHTGSPPIGTQLDPWIRRDVPAIDEDSFGPGPTRAIDS